MFLVYSFYLLCISICTRLPDLTICKVIIVIIKSAKQIVHITDAYFENAAQRYGVFSISPNFCTTFFTFSEHFSLFLPLLVQFFEFANVFLPILIVRTFLGISHLLHSTVEGMPWLIISAPGFMRRISRSWHPLHGIVEEMP